MRRKTSKADPPNVQGSAGQQILWSGGLWSGPAGKGSEPQSSPQRDAGEKLSCGAPGHQPYCSEFREVPSWFVRKGQSDGKVCVG